MSAEQKQIVARVEELLRWCDTLEAQLHQTHTLGAHLLASTLQRGSCRAVIAAVVADDLAAADDAWRGIDVAFAHQRNDGGFEAESHPPRRRRAVSGGGSCDRNNSSIGDRRNMPSLR